jgi:hypothetical protein
MPHGAERFEDFGDGGGVGAFEAFGEGFGGDGVLVGGEGVADGFDALREGFGSGLFRGSVERGASGAGMDREVCWV